MGDSVTPSALQAGDSRSLGRRVSGFLYRRPRLTLALLLAAPLLWLGAPLFPLLRVVPDSVRSEELALVPGKICCTVMVAEGSEARKLASATG